MVHQHPVQPRTKPQPQWSLARHVATAGAWVSGFAADEVTGEADDGAPLAVVAMGGDMLVHATGGLLPPTRHRVVCWPAEAVRHSMIMGMYGADTATLQPDAFREQVCGLPPLEGLDVMGCRESRSQKLYLDPEVRGKGKQPTTSST